MKVCNIQCYNKLVPSRRGLGTNIYPHQSPTDFLVSYTFESGRDLPEARDMVPELLQIGPILSVCLSVVCSTFFSVDFWTDSEQNSLVIS